MDSSSLLHAPLIPKIKATCNLTDVNVYFFSVCIFSFRNSRNSSRIVVVEVVVVAVVVVAVLVVAMCLV